MLFSYWTFFLFSWYFFLVPIEKEGLNAEKKERTRSRAENSAILGRTNLIKKRFATAASYFAQSVEFAKADKVDSCVINSTIWLANAYRNLNNVSKTEELLKKVEVDPGFKSYQNTLGYSTYLYARSSLVRKQGDTIKSIHLIDSAINHSLRWFNAKDTAFSVPFHLKAFIYYNLKNLDSALIYYKKALLTYTVNNKKEDNNLVNIYIGIIKIYELKDDFNNTIESIEHALKIINKLPKQDTQLIVNYYRLSSILNKRLGRVDNALNDIAQLDLIIKNSPSEQQLYIQNQITKSTLYELKGDLERAESQLLNLINDKQRQRYITQLNYYYIYTSLGSYAYNKDLFKKALSYYQKSLAIGLKLNIETSPQYNSMGSCNFLLGDTIKAEHFYKLGISTRIQFHGPNTPYLVREYLSYSIFLKRIGRIKEGLYYITQSLNIYRHEFGEKFKGTSQAFAWYGTFFLDGKQPEKALEYFQRAIVSAVVGFGDYNVESNPSLSGTYFGPELIEALKYKAQALDSIYTRDPKRLDILRNEFNTYELVLQAIHKQRTSFPELNSKLMVSGNEKTTYLGAVNAAYQLFRQTGDPQYKAKALEFAEKGRSSILLSSLKEKQAMSYGGLPDSLIEKEKSYNQLIEKYQGMLVEEKQKQGANPEVIKEIESKIFQVRSSQNDLIARFEKQFPQYYQLKYSDKVLDVNTLQKRLSDNSAILEYAVTDRNILIFVITKNKFDLVPVSRTPAFDKSLNTLNNYLREVSFVSQDRDIYEGFLTSGYHLYKNLIQPVATLINGKELIIIPDETLSPIPFEVLLTAQADPMQEFSTLPYLIEKYPIGYAYSANLLFFNYKKQIPEKVRLAAFSPTYDMAVKGNFSQPYLKPLKFAKEEARTASEFFRGRVFDGEEATESNFKDIVENYDILHLAMHAVLDNENPMYSKLAFTREDDKKEDGYLNTYELFNMKLKARMVVLSACNTGAGTLQKGEGIMSLARGFYYAGCPDVVMTLWPVEDKMSTQLIKDFYTYLSKGMNKIEALRLAKLNLIQSSDPLRSHPFFWAGYVNIGDISPVISIPKKKPTGMLWALTLGISVLLIVPMVWKKFRR